MRVCIDVLTPKHVLFYSKVKEKLERSGHTVILTTRGYREAEQLLALKGLKAEVIGRHGGSDIYSKLIESAKRIIMLAQYVERVKPEVCLSFSSPEMARVAFGLKIPHITANDSPHSIFVAKLTVPLSSLLCTPWIMVDDWLKLGLCLSKERIVAYKALDCVAWLKDFDSDRRVIEELGLTTDKPIITVRPTERQASYVSKEGVDSVELIKHIIATYPDLQVVVLPRYEDISYLKNALPHGAVVAERTVDAANLLFFSHVFIGGGGTMTTEACLMGVPSINFFPHPVNYLEYLTGRGLLWNATNLTDIIELLKKILKDYDGIKKKLEKTSAELIQSMEDPAEVIANAIKAVT